MRYLPAPFHTKYAQQRTALSQYIQQEAVGTRMRRWERPIHDFLAPYLRGAIGRVTGEDVIPEEVQHRRDLDTLTGLGPFLAPHNISLPRAGGSSDPFTLDTAGQTFRHAIGCRSRSPTPSASLRNKENRRRLTLFSRSAKHPKRSAQKNDTEHRGNHVS
jgi:hypothetical protein